MIQVATRIRAKETAHRLTKLHEQKGQGQKTKRAKFLALVMFQHSSPGKVLQFSKGLDIVPETTVLMLSLFICMLI
jgi:hypothetical protein